ncbi:MAG: FprA family A-type flavoprotein [Candidatus Schekmanbacteria bacterium]|nr:FprA family A-type flavoprotein [Candidatus Schekmanbacteria bacterium]
MKDQTALEMGEGIYGVGVKDWDLKIFDALISLPYGTSYNSYLVKGKQKTALIDTVKPVFGEEMIEKIKQVADPSDIDYLVMNHAEPDHAGSIPAILEMSKKAVLITSEKGAGMAKLYYNVPEDRIRKVKEGDSIDLGGRTLRFIDAPWLHWPETMFTYLVEDKVLFPCDFFGGHTAAGSYDEDVDEIVSYAKRYYGEIMMPYRMMGKKAMDKVKALDIRMIAPSHGPVYKNPAKIMEPYSKWTSGETKKKALLVFVSMWGSTAKMIKTMAETLVSEGVEVIQHDLTTADTGDIAKDLVDSRAIVLGAPTVLGGMHPLAIYGASLVKALRPPVKYGAFVGSYGWGSCAGKEAVEILKPAKIEIVGALEVNGPPTAADLSKVVEIGRQLAAKINSEA